jgi:hypothetical protein
MSEVSRTRSADSRDDSLATAGGILNCFRSDGSEQVGNLLKRLPENIAIRLVCGYLCELAADVRDAGGVRSKRADMVSARRTMSVDVA